MNGYSYPPCRHSPARRLLWVVSIGALAYPPFAARADEPAASKAVDPDHVQRAKEGTAFFKTEVRQLLEQHCLKCHGGESIKGDFDLSSHETLDESGMVGEDAVSSQLFAVITHADEPHMPKDAPKLPDEAIAKLERWLDLGAPYDRPLVERAGASVADQGAVTDEDRAFWSFRPLEPVQPPSLDNDWVRTPVDRFIVQALVERGLEPNAEADRRTLIRRAYFDLIGLPPTAEEVDSFVRDSDPAAYDLLIDRLLESPHYGERWARHWMDIARFAESHGYEQDYDRPNAYPYRDFLIKALNENMPYDQFLRWQVAGDELAPDDPLAMMATGFLGAGAFPTQLTETEFESARYDELDDIVATLGPAVLGLSVGCARCHTHKFDPIPMTDYYRLIASFTTTIRAELDLDLDPAGNRERLEKFERELARLKADSANIEAIAEFEKTGPQLQLTKVQVSSEGLPHIKHHADDRGFPHFYPQTFILARGDVQQKKEVATTGYLQVLMRDGYGPEHWRVPKPEGWTRTSFDRASLANWLTDVEHGAGPLAARVIVNRLWQHHLGRGIVGSPSDFGKQGEPPSHPDLLNWLANDLVANGWKLKRLQKLIMTSAVYRQSGQFHESRAKVDPGNQFLWRFGPRRLEAEAIRDSMLHVSGLLDPTMFGPGSLDPNMRRRSVYFFIKRSQLIPMMMLFDWPEHLVSIGERSRTTIAPQALAFLNSAQARAYAEGLASRLEPRPASEQIATGYRICFSRAPSPRETELATAFLQQQSMAYEAAQQDGASHLALVDWCQALLSTNEFIYVE